MKEVWEDIHSDHIHSHSEYKKEVPSKEGERLTQPMAQEAESHLKWNAKYLRSEEAVCVGSFEDGLGSGLLCSGEDDLTQHIENLLAQELSTRSLSEIQHSTSVATDQPGQGGINAASEKTNLANMCAKPHPLSDCHTTNSTIVTQRDVAEGSSCSIDEFTQQLINFTEQSSSPDRYTTGDNEDYPTWHSSILDQYSDISSCSDDGKEVQTKQNPIISEQKHVDEGLNTLSNYQEGDCLESKSLDPSMRNEITSQGNRPSWSTSTFWGQYSDKKNCCEKAAEESLNTTVILDLYRPVDSVKELPLSTKKDHAEAFTVDRGTSQSADEKQLDNVTCWPVVRNECEDNTVEHNYTAFTSSSEDGNVEQNSQHASGESILKDIEHKANLKKTERLSEKKVFRTNAGPSSELDTNVEVSTLVQENELQSRLSVKDYMMDGTLHQNNTEYSLTDQHTSWKKIQRRMSAFMRERDILPRTPLQTDDERDMSTATAHLLDEGEGLQVSKGMFESELSTDKYYHFVGKRRVRKCVDKLIDMEVVPSASDQNNDEKCVSDQDDLEQSFISIEEQKTLLNKSHERASVKRTEKKFEGGDTSAGCAKTSTNDLFSALDWKWQYLPLVRLDRHQSSSFGFKEFQCNNCQQRFKDTHSIFEHYKVHIKQELYKCKNCSVIFTVKSTLSQHQCLKPSADCATPKKLKIFQGIKALLKKQGNDELYKCTHCDKNFKSSNELSSHEQNKHAKPNLYHCQGCGKQYTYYAALLKHQNATDETGKNTKCMGSSTVNEKLDRHNILQNSPQNTEPPQEDDQSPQYAKCFVKLFDYRKQDGNGEVGEVTEDEKDHNVCLVCRKVFKKRCGLIAHYQIHNNDKPFKCVYCPKTFKHLSRRSKHMATQCRKGGKQININHHSSVDKGPYKCPICLKKFKYSFTRTSHLRKLCFKNFCRQEKETMNSQQGSTNKLFKCPMCPKTFTVSSNRTRHLVAQCLKSLIVRDRLRQAQHKTHGKERPFKCPYCPKSFYHSSNKCRHMRIHKTNNTEKIQEPSALEQIPVKESTSSNPPEEKTVVEEAYHSMYLKLKYGVVSCKICKKEFKSPSAFKVHWRTHSGERPYECTECKKRFVQLPHLQRHLLIHGKRNQCLKCKKVFNTLSELVKHRRVHLKSSVPQCTNCSKTFRSHSQLSRHQCNLHENVFLCEICEKNFENADQLIQHLQCHVGQTEFKCVTCNEIFDTPKALKIHRHRHTSVKETKYPCKLCGKVFWWKANLRRHILIHTGFKVFCCNKCGKRFSKNYSLKIHLSKCGAQASNEEKEVTMENDFPGQLCKDVSERRSVKIPCMFKCTFCFKSFNWKSGLYRHLKKHEGEKKYRCQKCDRAFFRKDHFQKHLYSCKGLKDFCNLSKPKVKPDSSVDATEASLKNLQNDKWYQMHYNNNGLYACKLCSKTFAKKGAFSRHVQTHSGLKLFSCSKCTRSYSRSDNLKHHMKYCVGTNLTNLPDDKPLEAYSILGEDTNESSKLDVDDAHSSKEVMTDVSVSSIPETVSQDSDSKKKEVQKEVKWDELFLPKKGVKKGISQSSLKDHTCPYCAAQFTAKMSLIRHIRLHTNEKPYSCIKCGKKFSRNDVCLSHQSNCLEVNVCDQDDSSTHVSQILKINENAKIPKEASSMQREYKCKFCTMSFQWSKSLRRHILTHTDVKPYRCEKCDSCFARYDYLKFHQIRCRNQKKQADVFQDKGLVTAADNSIAPECQSLETIVRHKCETCDKSFSTKSDLLRHTAMMHLKNKPFSCSLCGNQFTKMDSIKSHLKSCKAALKIVSTTVENDSKRASNLETLEESAQKIDDSSSPELLRHIENTACRETSKLLKRIESHLTNKKLFLCNYCKKTFSAKEALKRHFRTHTGEKPFQCDRCGERFMRRDYLQRHMTKCFLYIQKSADNGSATHEQALCDKCGVFFTRQEYLGHHAHNCIGETKSSEAGAVKAQEANDHHAIPMEGDGFICADCGEEFVGFLQLQEHRNTVHIGVNHSESDVPQKKKVHLPPSPLKTTFVNGGSIKQEVLDEEYGLSCSNQPKLVQLPVSPLNKDIKRNSPIVMKNSAKPFRCQFCPKQFSSHGHAKEHIRTHTGEKPFSCNMCTERFFRKDYLMRHMKKCVVAQSPVMSIDVSNNSLKREHMDSSPQYSTNTVVVINSGPKATGTGVLQTGFSCKVSGDSEKMVYEKRHSSRLEKRYDCSECDQSFTDSLSLSSHLREHGKSLYDEELNKNKHVCSYCGLSFKFRSLLQRHQEKHSGNLPYKCPHCPRSFRFPSEFNRHSSSHGRVFSCKFCNKRFADKLVLRQHQNSSHGSLLYRCADCGSGYANRRLYNQHRRKVHGDALENIILPELQNPVQLETANVCSEQQLNKRVGVEVRADEQQGVEKEEGEGEDEDAEDHDEENEDEDSDSAPYFPCHVCGKTFTTSESLEDHQRCHLGEKPHECAECGKCFFQQSHLQQHQRTHEKTFQCLPCGKGFISLGALRKHRRSHTKKRPFHCTKCPQRFTRSAHLVEHMATHSDETFPCDICGRTFSCRVSRDQHRKTHSESSGDMDQGEFSSHLLSTDFVGSSETQPPPLISPQAAHLSPVKSTNESDQLNISETSADELKYSCLICKKRFQYPSKLLEHQKYHTGERPYSCLDCGKRFVRGTQLKKHQLSHQLPPPKHYQCNTCGKVFSSLSVFISHQNQHMSEDGFKCTECPKTFKNLSDFSQHCLIHNREKPFKCHTCGKQFIRKSNLTVHQKKHVGQTQYECTECDGNFPGLESFKQHHCVRMQRHLQLAMQFKDSKASSQQYTNAWENENESSSAESSFFCHICSKSFSSFAKLEEHQRLHRVERPFECSECDKRFYTAGHLRKHQESHERQYQCDKCPQGFSSVRAFLQHQNLHGSDRPHQCDICLKRFVSTSDLAKHLRKHAEENSFQCDMCWKTFSQASYLKRHQESHVGEVVYECTECDKAFASFQLLQQHQNVHAMGHLDEMLTESPLESVDGCQRDSDL